MLQVLQDLNDEELFFLVKKNNLKAFKKIFDKYYSKLCYFSYNYVKSTELSEEVVSEVFINIWEKRNNLEITTGLKAYLYRATRNRSINYILKEQKYWDTLDINDYENELTSKSSPHDVFDLKDLEEIVELMMQKLPPRRQLVFRLHRIDGLSTKEIAELLSISINTVQNHMIKAMSFIVEQYPEIKKLFPK